MVIETETVVIVVIVIVIVIITLSAGNIVTMRRMTGGTGVIGFLAVTCLDRLIHLTDPLADTAVNETVTMTASTDTTITAPDRAVTIVLVTAVGIAMSIARKILTVIAAEIETIDVIETETMIVPQVDLVNTSETGLRDDHLTNNPSLKTAMAVVPEKTTAADATSTINEMARTIETELHPPAQCKTNPTPRSWRKSANVSWLRCSPTPMIWNLIGVSASLKSMPRRKSNGRLMTSNAQTVADSCHKCTNVLVRTVWMNVFDAAVVVFPRWMRSERAKSTVVHIFVLLCGPVL
jgi:hypothetical protein